MNLNLVESMGSETCRALIPLDEGASPCCDELHVVPLRSGLWKITIYQETVGIAIYMIYLFRIFRLWVNNV
jgi:hypothetical protein